MAIVENGVTTLYVGADKEYKTILDAVKAASTTGATEIIVSNGDYEGFTFAASEIGEQKGAITIKAAADAENVNITSPIRIGTYKKGSMEPLELQTWGANVTLEGLNFSNDTTAACLSIENMQTAGQLTVRKCNFVNEVANSNVIAAAKECPVGLRPVFEDCTITGLVSLVSGLQDGIEWNNCDFYSAGEGCVNIPGGTKVFFNDCDFYATLTEDSVGNSFYFIRNQNNPYVEINGGSVNLDSELTEAVEKQYDWGLFWTRNNGKQIALNDVEVNLTDAAMMQTESGLAVVMAKVKGETGAILTDPENISVKNMTSGNDVPVEDLLAASTGAFNAMQDGQYSQYTYDGEGNRVVKTVSLDKIYVDGSWTDKSDLGEGKIFGVNAFADYASAKAAVSDVTEKVVIAGDINAGGVFDNLIEVGEGNAYWSGPSPVENTFAVEVNAAVKSGSTVLNNNTVTVGETGSIEAFDHHLTVFGEAGSLVVDGDADGSVRNTEKQLAVSQLRVAFGGSADIRDTSIEVRAITVGADAWDDTGYSSTLTLTNTKVEYHGFADGSQLNINVKEGNTLSIADSEFVKKYTSSTIAVVNNGTFELSDSSLDAQSFTNNGTFTVGGVSTLNIASGSGNIDLEGTLAAGSNAGGMTIRAQGTDAKIVGEADKATNLGVVKVNGSTEYSDTAVALEISGTNITTSTLYIGTTGGATTGNKLTITGDNNRETLDVKSGAFYVKAKNDFVLNDVNFSAGQYSINGTMTVTNSVLACNDASFGVYSGGSLSITNSILTTWTNKGNLNGGIFLGDGGNGWGFTPTAGTMEVLEGSSVKTTAVVLKSSQNALTVEDSSIEAVTKISVGEDAKVTLEGTATLETDAMDNAGTITMDASSDITATAITGTGDLVIKLTADEIASGITDKVIDVTDGSAFDSITVVDADGNAVAGFGAFRAEDGDVWVSNADMSTLYVDSAWSTGYEFGAAITGIDGAVFGMNAFASFADAAAKINTDGSDTTIVLQGDENGVLNVDKSIVFDYGTGDINFTADSAVTVKQTKNGLDFDFSEAQDITITIDKNVTFEISDNAAGMYVYYGPSLDVYGTITGGQNWGCLYLYNGTHTVYSTGELSTGRIHLGYTDLTVNGGNIDTNYLLVEGSTFTATGATIDANVIYDNHNGSQRWGESEFYITDSTVNSSKVTVSYADSIFELSGGSLSAGEVVNNGKFTVAGETELNIATASGNKAITFADGAVLTSKTGASFNAKTHYLNGVTFGSGAFNFGGAAYATKGELALTAGAEVTVASTFAIYDGASASIDADATLAASSLYWNGGNIEVNGTLKAIAGNDGGLILNAAGDTLTVNNGGVLDVSYVDIYYSTGNATVNIAGGEAKVGFKLYDGSGKFTWNITGNGSLDVQKNGIIIGNKDSSINVTGGTLTATSITNAGTITVEAGSSLSVNGTLTLGAYLNISGLTANTDYGFNIDGNALTATADKKGNISLFTTALTDGEKSVTLVDTATYATFEKTVTVTNGSLTVNVDSEVAFKTLTAAKESIIVDTDGYTDGTKRILNNKGADLTKADYEAVVKGDAALDATVGAGKFIVANGDLYLTDAKQDVLYVNSTYTEDSAYADGYILGYDMFNSLSDAMDNAAAETTEIRVMTDSEEALSGKTFSGKIVAGGDTVVTVTDSENSTWVNLQNIQVGENVCIDAKNFYVYNTNVIDGALISGTTFYSSGKTMINGSLEAYTVMSRYYDNADDGIYVVGTAKAGEAADAEVQLRGKNYLGHYSGTFSVKDAAVEFGYILLNGSNDKDGYPAAKLVLDNGSIKTIGGPNTQPGQVLMDDDAEIIATNNSVLDFRGPKNYAYISVGENNKITLTDSTMLLGQSGQGVSTNDGTISLTDSVFLAGTFTNNDIFTVSSTEGKSSTLNIGGLTGALTAKDVTFADGTAVGRAANNSGSLDLAGSYVNFDGEVTLGVAVDSNYSSDVTKITVNKNATVNLDGQVYAARNGGWEGVFNIGAEDTLIIDGTLNATGSGDRANMYLKGTTIVNGEFNVTDLGFQNTVNTLTVKGAMTIVDTYEDGAYQDVKLAGHKTATGSLIVDGGTLTVTAPSFGFGGQTGSTWTDAPGNTTAEILNGGKLTTNAKFFCNGTNNTLTVSGSNSVLEFTTVGEFGTVHNTVGSEFINRGTIEVLDGGSIDMTGRALTNSKTISVTNGTFTADKVTGNGTFTVSGTSSISGDFTEAVISAAGATINTNGLTDDALIAGVTYGAGTFTITGTVGAGTVDVSAGTTMIIESADLTGALVFDDAAAEITVSKISYTGSLNRNGVTIVDGVDNAASVVTINGVEYTIGEAAGTDGVSVKWNGDALVASKVLDVVPDENTPVTDADSSWYYGGDAVTTDTASSSIATETKTLNVELTENNEDGGRYFGGSSISGEVEASYYSRNTEVNVSGMGIQNGVYGGNFIAEGADVKSSFSDSTVNITATQGAAFENLIVGGNRVNDSAFVTLRGTSSVSISGAEDATYKDHVIGGSLASGTGAVAENDNTSVTIDCGKFSGNIYGGGYAQRSATVTVENASVTINGGTFSGKIYGGNGAASAQENTVAETTSVTINGGTFNSNIYGGSFGLGRVDVSSTVTINGGTFGDIVIDGDSSNAEFYNKEAVADRNLIFNGYDAALEANIRNFDTVKFLDDSDIDMTNGTFDAAEVDVWSFENGASIKGLGDVAFDSEDTLEIYLKEFAADVTGGDSWTIMTGSSIDISELDNVIANIDGSLAYFQKSGEVWQYSDYTLSLEDGDTEDSLVVVKKGSIA